MVNKRKREVTAKNSHRTNIKRLLKYKTTTLSLFFSCPSHSENSCIISHIADIQGFSLSTRREIEAATAKKQTKTNLLTPCFSMGQSMLTYWWASALTGG
jgi:hypothetical protein